MSTSDSFELLLNHMLKDLRDVNDALALIGIYHVTKLTVKAFYKTFIGFRSYLLPRIFSNKKWIKSLGNWAMISGNTYIMINQIN